MMEREPGHYSSGNSIEIYRGGKAYFDVLLERLNKARVFIHIQVYILGKDRTGYAVLETLFAAAKRGVPVYLMLDAYGSSWVKAQHLIQWKKQGLNVKLFSRRLRFKRLVLGRRQHSKLVVIDNEWMSVGGLNFADRYSGFDGAVPWLDAACWVKGPAAALLSQTAAVYWRSRKERFLRSQQPLPELPDGEGIWVFTNDWLRRKFEIRKAYQDAIDGAKNEIILIAAYFFPSRKMLRLLLQKASEGVRITLLFSAVSDVPLVKPATEYFYHKLRTAGIEIREWDESVLHAKIACIDQEWVTFGSYNLNQLSDFGSLETNIAFESKEMAKPFYQQLIQTIYPRTRQIDTVSHRMGSRLKRYFSYLALRIALRILFLTNHPPR
ncbi:MAG: hypothetical protein GC180_05695 [Bacteroidetes bacterium]|nr:hypothetical protein [Bacteroidota bacterium]